MDAVNEIPFSLSLQLGGMNIEISSNSNALETQQNSETNSFLSILNLLDVNADGKIDTDELKFGAGFMINSMLYSQDLDGDQALTAEEAGVSSSLVSQLDTDSDQMVNAKEMISVADKIIDALVPVLDTNGDNALSRDELGIFELLFAGNTNTNKSEENVEETGAVQQSTEGTEAYQSGSSESESSQQIKNVVSLKA